MQKNKILILGDSHADVFNCITHSEYLFFPVVSPGATSRGVNNPNSKTNTLEKFIQALENYKEYNICILMLGEVDCGFTIWHSTMFKKTTLLQEFKKSINAYKKFVYYLHTLFNKNIILLGASFPTIKDNTDKRYLSGERSKVNASYIQRLRITKLYNNSLQKIAKELNINYIDINKEIFETSTNYIKSKYLNKDIYDHHLNTETTKYLWSQKIFESLNESTK